MACRDGKLELVYRLLKTPFYEDPHNLNEALEFDNHNAIRSACFETKLKVIAYLLGTNFYKNADNLNEIFNKIGEKHCFKLLESASCYGQEGMVERVLQTDFFRCQDNLYNALKTDSGGEVLHNTCLNGSPKQVKKLLDVAATIETTDIIKSELISGDILRASRGTKRVGVAALLLVAAQQRQLLPHAIKFFNRNLEEVIQHIVTTINERIEPNSQNISDTYSKHNNGISSMLSLFGAKQTPTNLTDLQSRAKTASSGASMKVLLELYSRAITQAENKPDVGSAFATIFIPGQGNLEVTYLVDNPLAEFVPFVLRPTSQAAHPVHEHQEEEERKETFSAPG